MNDDHWRIWRLLNGSAEGSLEAHRIYRIGGSRLRTRRCRRDRQELVQIGVLVQVERCEAAVMIWSKRSSAVAGDWGRRSRCRSQVTGGGVREHLETSWSEVSADR